MIKGGQLRVSKSEARLAYLGHVLMENANGLVVLRMRGGLREAMRFFQLTDPAITRPG